MRESQREVGPAAVHRREGQIFYPNIHTSTDQHNASIFRSENRGNGSWVFYENWSATGEHREVVLD